MHGGGEQSLLPFCVIVVQILTNAISDVIISIIPQRRYPIWSFQKKLKRHEKEVISLRKIWLINLELVLLL